MKDNLGLYIHIPFCKKKCNYCDFYSIEAKRDLQQDYINACLKEIFSYKDITKTIDTIYIGGGTPSILPLDLLETLIKAINDNFVVKTEETTIEVNPCSSNNIEYYKDLGINRLSIGIQSLNDNLLSCLNRQHDRKTALLALDKAKKYFDNISCDVMLGIPLQTTEILLEDLTLLTQYVHHLSAYILKVENDTPLNSLIKKGVFSEADEELIIELYQTTVNFLSQQGLLRYETSNFAKKGFESKHNLKYWTAHEYIGIGASAHSFLNNQRYYNKGNILDYINDTPKSKVLSENLDNKALLNEKIMLGLRLDKGINIKEIEKEFEINFLAYYAKAIDKTKDFIIINNDYLRLNNQGFLIQNSIISEFYEL